MLAPTDWPGPMMRLRTLPLNGALMDERSRFLLASSSDDFCAATFALASRSCGFLRTRSFGSSSNPMSFQFLIAWAAVASSLANAASERASDASAVMI